MTALLYISYSSGLSEADKLSIDKSVFENRLAVSRCNVKDKTKRLIIVISLTSVIWFSSLKSGKAIGLNMPPTPIVIVCPSYQHDSKVQIAKVFSRKKHLIAYKSEILFLMYLTDPRLSSNQEILKFTKELRGGDLSLIVGLGLIGLAVLVLAFSASEVESLIPLNRQYALQPPGVLPKFPPHYELFSPRKTLGSPKYGSTLQITRPSEMPQSDFSALSKADKRRLYDIRDMKIKHEGYPELDVGFWQSEKKVRKHGAIHGLEYTVHEKNGGTITEKSEENVLKMMRSIVDMPNRDKVEWFVNGTFQNGTKRQFEAIHIYDPSNQIIAVFEKSTRKFVTTCQLTPEEAIELRATGNFGGGEKWFSKEAKNLPPQQKFVSDFTSVNSFESDVLGITPISAIDTSPNPGFTPINSFESDVMNITPIDNP